MKKWTSKLLIITLLAGLFPAWGQTRLGFREVATLPATDGRPNPGVAGAFAGFSNGVLLVAGGANFPDGPPWQGGKKSWQKSIYVLDTKTATPRWLATESLPHPLAYGASVSYENQLIGLGGSDADRRYADVFSLAWAGGRVVRTALPPLPEPVASLSAAHLGEDLYAFGGESAAGAEKGFYRLSLKTPEKGWQRMPAFPGAARAFAALTAQSDGDAPALYLLGGRATVGGRTTVFKDAWCFRPATGQWSRLPDMPTPLAAHTAVASGSHAVLIFGGDEGTRLREIEALNNRIGAVSGKEKNDLTAQRNALQANHAGFQPALWQYHTVLGAWSRLDSLPFRPQVTAPVLFREGTFWLVSGETSPGVRTPLIRSVSLETPNLFSLWDYAVLGLYLLLLLYVSSRFAHNQQDTQDYFKGGGRIPAWAAGISIFGAKLSAITFIAIPAKAYATNWSYYILLLTIFLITPLILHVFIPAYRRLNVTSAYEFLESRFNLTARLIGGLMFLCVQLGRVAIVMFLPSLALSLVTGLDVSVCILLMGVFSIAYTVMGGIEAVIWTEVIQVSVLFGGAILCFVLLWFQVDQPFGQMMQTALDHDKFHILDFRLDFTTPTFWVVLLGGLATNTFQYGAEQTVVQRYMVTTDTQSSVRSLKLGTYLTLPSSIIFLGLGTLLYLFYRQHPSHLSPTLTNSDTIFPWYMVTELPAGLRGLLIAAIFAAAMSALEAAINSVSTVLTVDFLKRFRPDFPEKASLRFARLSTVGFGVFGIGVALVMARQGISSFWDQFNLIMGLFTGSLCGMFLLGLFTKKVSGRAAVAAWCGSALLQVLLLQYASMHLLMYSFTGLVSCVVLGLVLSVLMPDKT